jgi:pimeloyl-ACP methyl ester carboxylesterase
MARLRRIALVAGATAVVSVVTSPPAGAQVGGLGVNDWGCKPPPHHRYPVVVVHGVYLNSDSTSRRTAAGLRRLGYCVFSVDYGMRGTARMEVSGGELARFVGRVLDETGALRVSIVGHSSGGTLARYYAKFLAGTTKIDDLVTFAAPHNGTSRPLLRPFGSRGPCDACAQQVAGSPFIRALNEGNPTPRPVSYTQVATRLDGQTDPYTSAHLPSSPDGRVTNVTVQSRCPLDFNDHVGVISDRVALQWMLNALGRRGPAAGSFRPDCTGRLFDRFPDSDSGVVPQDLLVTVRPCKAVRGRLRAGGFRRSATLIRTRGIRCPRARRVAIGWLNRGGRRVRFRGWTCRTGRRRGRSVRVRCTRRGGQRVSFRGRR